MKLEDVQEILSKINGCTFASMDTATDVALLGGKANPMKGHTKKLAKGHRVMLFTNQNSNGYENMVNRRLEKEGKSVSFDVAERKWGTRVPNTPFIEHKGEHYLEVIFLGSGETSYEFQGNPIAQEDITGFPAPRTDSGRQGLDDDNRVVIRSFKLSSIKTIRVMNEEIS